MAKKTSKIPVKQVVPAIPDMAPRFPAPVILSISAIWALIVLAYYGHKTGFFYLKNPFDIPLWLAYLPEAGHILVYFPQMLFVAMFTAFALAVGGILLNAIAGPDNRDIGELDWLFFSLGLGFGALSLLTLGMGFLGLCNKYAMFSLIGLGLLAGGIRFRKDFQSRLQKLLLEIWKLRFSWFDKLLLFILFLYAAMSFFWALSPEIFFDSLVYHLGVPNYYLQEGHIAAMPFNICSGFPLLVQMLYMAGIIVSDEVLPRLIHFFMGLLLAGTLFAVTRRYASASAGLLATLFFFSMPLVILNLNTSGMDVGSCWFTLLAAYALVLFSAREEKSEPRIFDRTLLLAGILTGLACGTKYQALFTVIAGFGVLLFRYFAASKKENAGLALRQALYYGAAAGLVFSPWPLKNVFFHGNPLYPFLGKVFGGQQVDPYKWTMLLSDGYSRSLSYTFENWNNLREFILHPWYLTFHSSDSTADFVGPVILICLPLLFLFRLKRPAFRHMAVFVAVMWLLWCVSTSMSRFFLQGLAVLSVLFATLIAGSETRLKWLLRVILVIVSWYSFSWLNMIVKSQDGWRVVYGLQDKESYLSLAHSTYPSPYYSAMKYINTSLPSESRVLFAGETRGFYCERRFIAPSVHDVHTLVSFARGSATPGEMQEKMISAGITHVFLNLVEAMRLDKSYHLFQWDADSIRVFNAWWDRYVRLVWSDVSANPYDYRLLFVYSVAPGQENAPLAPVHNYLNDLYLKSQSDKPK